MSSSWNGEVSPDERDVLESISLDEPWTLIEEFAGLERMSGTEDEQTAAAYLTERLDALGITYERTDPELYISQPHSAAIHGVDRDLDLGPVKTPAFSASGRVQGTLQYVGSAGPGTLDTEETPENPFSDVGDLDGRIALTAAGSLSIRVVRILEAKGAAGVIAIHEHPREPHDGIVTPIWGGAPRYDERERLPDMPVVHVSKPDGATLRELAELPEAPAVELETDLTTEWMECPVVVAEVDGGAQETDDFLLLHGHYDSWHTGVTDNATGDATLLELARVFDNHADALRRNLRIAWWPAHSTGRYAGSTWYADEFALDIAEHCIAHVNVDSPGAAGSTEYTDMSCWCPEAHDLVVETIDDIAGAPAEEHFPYRAGDYSFDNLGVTGFFMLSSNIPADVREERGWHTVGGSGGNADAWHLTTDTINKAGREELLRDTRVYALAVLRTLTAEVLPFDHTRTVQKMTEAVSEYDAAAGDHFDLAPTMDALKTLEEELGQFETDVRSGEIPPARANEVISALSRILTGLYLTSEGRFEQDPAVGRAPVPRLAPARRFPTLEDDEVGFLRTQLRREQNTVLASLREARARLP